MLVFFVAQEGKDFYGYWSGWDETNHKIASGAYVFKQKPKRMYVQTVTAGDRYKIANLSEHIFGHNYFENGIESNLGQYKDTATLLKAIQKGESKNIIGFSLSYMLPLSGLTKFLKIWESAQGDSGVIEAELRIPDDLIEADKLGKIGVIQTIAVAEDMRSRGIGRELLEHTELRLGRYLPAILVAPVWNTGGRMNAAKLLGSLKYTESLKVPEYWKKDCDLSKFACPNRTAQCMCHMSLFTKPA